jgi:RHS repeat-associated protein
MICVHAADPRMRGARYARHRIRPHRRQRRSPASRTLRRSCGARNPFTRFCGAISGHRYYNPSTGRWLSRDPIAGPGFGDVAATWRRRDVEGLALYGFVRNNVIGAVDWLGLATINPCGTDECKCLGCMVFAEARGTSEACQKAVADVIKLRAWRADPKDPTGFTKYRSFCEVVAERDGGEFIGYTTQNYKDCCADKCINTKGGPQDKTERDRSFKFSECDTAAGSYVGNANYFFSGSTPDWIKAKIKEGKATEVTVPGCDKFKFYNVVP